MSTSRGGSSRLSRKRKKEEGSESQFTAICDTTEDFADISTVFRLPKRSKVEKLLVPSRSQDLIPKRGRGRPRSTASAAASQGDKTKEHSSQGDKTKEHSSQGDKNKERSSQCDKTKERSSQGDKTKASASQPDKASVSDNSDFFTTLQGKPKTGKNSQHLDFASDSPGDSFIPDINCESFLCEGEKLCPKCCMIIPSDTAIFDKHLKQCVQKSNVKTTGDTESSSSKSKVIPSTSDQENENPQANDLPTEGNDPAPVVLPCPLCNKPLKSQTHRRSHTKSCAQKQGISSKKLLEAVRLQEKFASDRVLVGLPPVPEEPSVPKNAPPKKPKRQGTASSKTKDPDLAMAIALSLSSAEEEAEKRGIQEERLLCLGLDEIVEEDRKARPVLLPRVVESKGVKTLGKRGRGRGKNSMRNSVLATRSAAERERIISEKVGLMLAIERPSSDDFQKNAFQGGRKCLASFRDGGCSMWKSACNNLENPLEEYYVKDLEPYVKPKKSEVGRLLKNVTDIPGRLNVTMMQQSEENSDGASEGEEASVIEEYSTQLALADLLGSQDFDAQSTQGSASGEVPTNSSEDFVPNALSQPADGFWLESDMPTEVKGQTDSSVNAKSKSKPDDWSNSFLGDCVELSDEENCPVVQDKMVSDANEMSNGSEDRIISRKESEDCLLTKNNTHLNTKENALSSKPVPASNKSEIHRETDLEKGDCGTNYQKDKAGNPSSDRHSNLLSRNLDSLKVFRREIDPSRKLMSRSSQQKASSGKDSDVGRLSQQEKTSLVKDPDANSPDILVVESEASSDSDQTQMFGEDKNLPNAQVFDDMSSSEFGNEDLQKKETGKGFGNPAKNGSLEKAKSSKSKSLCGKLIENMKKSQSKTTEVSARNYEGAGKGTIVNDIEEVVIDSESDGEGEKTIIYETEKCDRDIESDEEGGARTIIFDEAEKRVGDSESDEEGGAKTIVYDEGEKCERYNESDGEGAKTIAYNDDEKCERDSESDEEGRAKTIIYDEAEKCESDGEGTKTIIYDDAEKFDKDNESDEEGGARTIIYDLAEKSVRDSESDEEGGAKTINYNDENCERDSESDEEGGAKTIIFDVAETNENVGVEGKAISVACIEARNSITDCDSDDDWCGKTIIYESDENLSGSCESSKDAKVKTNATDFSLKASATVKQTVETKEKLSDKQPVQKQKKYLKCSSKEIGRTLGEKENQSCSTFNADMKDKNEESVSSPQFTIDVDTDDTKLDTDTDEAMEIDKRNSYGSDLSGNSSVSNVSRNINPGTSTSVKERVRWDGDKSCNLVSHGSEEYLNKTLPSKSVPPDSATKDVPTVLKETSLSDAQETLPIEVYLRLKGDSSRSVALSSTSEAEKAATEDVPTVLKETLPHKADVTALCTTVGDGQETLPFEVYQRLKKDSARSVALSSSNEAEETMPIEEYCRLKKHLPLASHMKENVFTRVGNHESKNPIQTKQNKSCANIESSCNAAKDLEEDETMLISDYYDKIQKSGKGGTHDNVNVPSKDLANSEAMRKSLFELVCKYQESVSCKKSNQLSGKGINNEIKTQYNKKATVVNEISHEDVCSGDTLHRDTQEKDSECVVLQPKGSHSENHFTCRNSSDKSPVKAISSTPVANIVLENLEALVSPKSTETRDNKQDKFVSESGAKLVYDWSALLASGDESDITIEVDGEQNLTVHSIVFLARCSELHSEAKKSKRIYWKGVSYEGAYLFLVYLYTGKCSIETKDDPLWMDVYDLALKYNCEELFTYLESLYKNDTSLQGKAPQQEESKKVMKTTRNLPEILTSASQGSKMAEVPKASTRTVTRLRISSIARPDHSLFATPKTNKGNEPERFKISKRSLDLSPIMKEMEVQPLAESTKVCEDMESQHSFNIARTSLSAARKITNQNLPSNFKSPVTISNFKSPLKISKSISVPKSQSPDLFESTASVEDASFITTPPRSPLSISSLGNTLIGSDFRRPDKDKIAIHTSEDFHTPKTSRDYFNQDVTDSRDDNLCFDIGGEEKQQHSTYIRSDTSRNSDKSNVSVREELNFENNPAEVDDNNVVDLTNDSDDSVTDFEENKVTETDICASSILNCNNSEEDMEPLQLAESESEESIKEPNDGSHSHKDKAGGQGIVSEMALDIICVSPKSATAGKGSSEMACPSPKSSTSKDDNHENLRSEGVENEDKNAYISHVWDDFDDDGCNMPLDFPVTPAKGLDTNAISSSTGRKSQPEDGLEEVENVVEENSESPKSGPSTSFSRSPLGTVEISNFYSSTVRNQKHLHSSAVERSKATISDETMAKIQEEFDDSGLWREEFDPIFENEEAEDRCSSKEVKDRHERTQQMDKPAQHESFKTPKSKPTEKYKVTPMPKYKEMTSPALKDELKKFGIKMLKRNKAVTMLEYVYDKTHPYVTDSETDSSYIESPQQPQPTKTSRGGKARSTLAQRSFARNQKTLTKNVEEVPSKVTTTRGTVPAKENPKPPEASAASLDRDGEDDGDDSPLNSSQSSSLSDGSEMECMEESMLVGADEDVTPTQQDNLTSQVMLFITSDPDFHRKVLLYEPFFVEDLHAALKANGVKCNMSSVLDVLDNQCITFRTHQGQRQRQRGRKCKRKGNSSPNKSPKRGRRKRV